MNDCRTALKEKKMPPKIEDICNIQLPVFFAADVPIWFTLVEIHSEINGVTDERQKFLNISKSLPTEVAAEVIEAFQNPNEAEPYTNLKMVLLKRKSISEVTRIQLSDLADLVSFPKSQYWADNGKS